METLHTDVAVVGYGPVGRMLAIVLAEKGHRVTVVERQKTSYPLPRAVCMDHEIYRAMHAHGCATNIKGFSVPSPRYQWFGQDWSTLLDIDWTVESVSGGPEAHFFFQPALEAAMGDRIKQLEGITVLTEQEGIGFAQNGQSVTLDIEDRNTGSKRQIQAKFLVGCDGANSMVRCGLNIDWEDFGFNADFLVVDVALHDGVTLDIPSAGQFCHPERPTTFVPGGIKDGRVVRRWEFMRMPHETKQQFEDNDYVWGLLKRWVQPDQGEFLRHAVYTFRSLIAKRWRNGQVFLAGDAAHLTPPFLGQGMCSGLRDAINLGWRLDLVLQNVLNDSLLQHYEAERKPHIKQLIDIAMYLGKIICVSNPEEAAARDRAFLDGSAPPPPAFPHLAEGTLMAGAALAGRLSPHAVVHTGHKSCRLDDLTGPNFVFMARTLDHLEGLPTQQLEAMKSLRIKPLFLAAHDVRDARGIHDPSGKLDRFFEEHCIDAYIARPDGYIFAAAEHGSDVADLLSALAEKLPGVIPARAAIGSLA